MFDRCGNEGEDVLLGWCSSFEMIFAARLEKRKELVDVLRKWCVEKCWMLSAEIEVAFISQRVPVMVMSMCQWMHMTVDVSTSAHDHACAIVWSEGGWDFFFSLCRLLSIPILLFRTAREKFSFVSISCAHPRDGCLSSRRK